MVEQHLMKRSVNFPLQTVWMLLFGSFGLLFVGILWLAYQGTIPAALAQNDKLAHFVLYGIAAFLGHLALNRRRVTWLGWTLPLFPCLFGLFTVTEELSQAFSPHRSLDAWDLVASFAGIGLGYWWAERGRRLP